VSCSLGAHRSTAGAAVPSGDARCGFTPKGSLAAHGCARHTQRERRRQTSSLHYWLLAHLRTHHWDTSSALYAYNPLLPSDKAFFAYWPTIKQAYLEGKHDPTKSHRATAEAISFFLTAWSLARPFLRLPPLYTDVSCDHAYSTADVLSCNCALSSSYHYLCKML